jgi:hypothetical protein
VTLAGLYSRSHDGRRLFTNREFTSLFRIALGPLDFSGPNGAANLARVLGAVPWAIYLPEVQEAGARLIGQPAFAKVLDQSRPRAKAELRDRDIFLRIRAARLQRRNAAMGRIPQAGESVDLYDEDLDNYRGDKWHSELAEVFEVQYRRAKDALGLTDRLKASFNRERQRLRRSFAHEFHVVWDLTPQLLGSSVPLDRIIRAVRYSGGARPRSSWPAATKIGQDGNLKT